MASGEKLALFPSRRNAGEESPDWQADMAFLAGRGAVAPQVVAYYEHRDKEAQIVVYGTIHAHGTAENCLRFVGIARTES